MAWCLPLLYTEHHFKTKNQLYWHTLLSIHQGVSGGKAPAVDFATGCMESASMACPLYSPCGQLQQNDRLLPHYKKQSQLFHDSPHRHALHLYPPASTFSITSPSRAACVQAELAGPSHRKWAAMAASAFAVELASSPPPPPPPPPPLAPAMVPVLRNSSIWGARQTSESPRLEAQPFAAATIQYSTTVPLRWCPCQCPSQAPAACR